ncbi:SDR family NAD(P)-dependent oxidoreductase [Streptosporangium sp. NBC_01469]|uniref:SDR family NAD(P)-dependent oxidoreductase n=1 Tax=Streptosporangium sp. NBC_01469 TaxID=2903898 RepID=UPI002E289FD6|nr:SDR family NAD(P)-dependent oxidoreductase [Streptosporangium sp. NBC_01469]
MELQGVTALVSGAGGGLGAATARELAKAGAHVVVADLDAGTGGPVADEVGGTFVETDVTDAGSVERAVEVAAGVAGPLRVAVSCAGVAPAARTVGLDGRPHDLGTFERALAVNVVGTFNVMRLAAAAMAATEPLEDGERGVVVNTSSAAAEDGQAGQVAYAASKGAVAALTLPAARDLASIGVRVCALSPGLFDTSLFAAIPPEFRRPLVRQIVFPPRLGTPGEFARAVRAVCELGYLNAAVVRLDGGLRLPNT